MRVANFILIKPIKQFYFAKKWPFCLLSGSFLLGAISQDVCAEQVFNSSFLNDGHSGIQLSDLSRFNDAKQLPGTYRVGLYVNDEYIQTQDVNFVEWEDATDQTGLLPCFSVATLQSFGLNTAMYPELATADDNQCIIFPKIIADATSTFQFDKQRLKISLPQASLVSQIRGYIPPEQWDDGINSLFLNYSFSGYHNSNNDSKSLFLGLNNGLNLGSWQLRYNGTLRYNDYAGTTSHSWKNVDTYVRKSIVPLKSDLIIGDGSTDNDIFDSFRYRGVYLSSSDMMNPDSRQGYAPTIRGIAKTNAKVLIRQNGYVIHQVAVPPGPFVIQDLNPTSVSGDLSVSIEESDGAIQAYTVPYSSLAIFQREGQTKFNVLAGEFRSGLASQDDRAVFQFTAKHGLKSGTTVYSGVQVAEDYRSVLLGMGKNLGPWGAVSVDMTHADSTLVDGSEHRGQSYRFLYSKSLMNMGTTFQLLGYRYSTRGFYTLNDVAYTGMRGYDTDIDPNNPNGSPGGIIDFHNLYHAKKDRVELNVSHSMGKYGSFYLSGNQQSYWGTNRTNKIFQFGYTNVWNRLNYAFYVNKVKYPEIDKSETIYSASVSFPLSALWGGGKKLNRNEIYSNASAMHNSNGKETYQAGISGSLLAGKNLSYSLTQSHESGQDSSGSISATYNGTYGTVGAAYSYTGGAKQYSYNATGSVLAHENGLTFGQQIFGTSILVKAPGANHVGIENYNGVKTDWRGYAVVPYATEYRVNRVALNSTTFAENVEVKNNVSYVVPTKGAIVRARFNTSVGARVLATLKHQGEFVPYASQVTELNSAEQGMVAEDGSVYMTGLPLKGVLQVKWGSGTTPDCRAEYNLKEKDLNNSVNQIELVCQSLEQR